MIRNILIGIVALLLIFIIVIAAQPSTLEIKRSTTIAAQPATVFPFVNKLSEWTKWSPWDKLDPNSKHVYSGSMEGQGAVSHWTGNDKVGEGEMRITSSTPPTQVVMDVEFIKPYKTIEKATIDITPKITPDGAISEVTWKMIGPMGFIAKAMNLFRPFEKSVGSDFEQGLANLKTISESQEKANIAAAKEKLAAEAAAAEAAAAAQAAQEAAAKTAQKRR